MPSPIVTAYMDIVPTTKGLRGDVSRKLGADAGKVGRETGARAGDAAGEEAGRRTGRGIGAGIAASGGLVAGAIAGLAIGQQIFKSITGAGDLQQSIGAIDTVFAGSQDQMHAWADTAAQTVGLSKNEYNEFGTLIGSQLKNAGIPMGEVATQTNDLIGLGADMSSMFGGDASEAVGALSSALKGERDPIERYGVTLTQASIEAKAMELGLIGAGEEMDKQSEVAATLALITQQTADAQGNFGRESGTFQGQLQRVTAQWSDMRTALGMRLLPVLSSVIGFVNQKALPAMAGLGGTLREGAQRVREFFSSADAGDGGLVGFFARARDAGMQLGAWILSNGVPAARALWAELGPKLAPVVRGLGDSLSFVVVQGARFGSFLLEHRGTIGALATIVGSVVLAWKAYRLTMVTVAAVQAGWTAIVAGSRAAMAAFRAAVLLSSLAMRTFNLAMLANPIGLVIAGVAGLVAGFVLAYKRIGWFKTGVDAVWAGLKAGASGVLSWITGSLWPGIQSALSWVGGAFRNLGVIAGNIWSGVKSAGAGFMGWLTGTALPWARGALSNIGGFFTGFYRNAVRPAFDGVVSSGRWMLSTASSIFGILGAAVRGIGGVFSWLYANAVRPALNAIVSVAQWWWGGLKAVFGYARGGLRILGAGFTWLLDNAVRPVFRGIVNLAQWWWGGLKATFGLARGGLQWLGDKFEWARSWASSRFVAMRESLASSYRFIRASVIVPIRVALQWLGDKFEATRAWATSRFISMKDGLVSAYRLIRSGVIVATRESLQWLQDKFGSVRDGVVGIWGNLRQRLYDGYVAIRNRTINPLREAARRAQTTFEGVQSGIVTAWEKLRDGVKAPVVFVIDKVVNPFINAYNRANDFWHGSNIDPLSVGFRRGGILPGYEPRKRDDVLTPMRSGEGVLVPEVVRGLGPNFIHEANAAGNAGGVAAVRKWATEGYAKGGLIGPPLRGNWPISQYPNPGHMAVDIASPIGTPILAAFDGVVTHAGPGFQAPGVWGGNEVHISGGGYEAWYAHLNDIDVARGQRVRKGDHMGESGNTGISQGPHLHFGAFKGGYPNHINALDFLGGAFKYDPNAPAGGGGSFWQDPLGFVRDRVAGFFDMDGPLADARAAFAGNKFLEMPIGIGQKITGGLLEKAASLADPIINAVDAVKDYSSTRVAEMGSEIKAEAWIIEALRATNQFGPARFAAMKKQAFIESGYDPNARNTSAAGIAAGGPVGFMQTVPNTFKAWAMPGRTNILDPVDNGIAAIRYVIDKYGGIENIWPTKAGYAHGGIVDSMLYDGGGWLTNTGGPQLVNHRERKPDAVLSNRQWSDIHAAARPAVQAGVGAGPAEYHFHGVGPTDDPEHYARRSGEALADTFRKAGRF